MNRYSESIVHMLTTTAEGIGTIDVLPHPELPSVGIWGEPDDREAIGFELWVGDSGATDVFIGDQLRLEVDLSATADLAFCERLLRNAIRGGCLRYRRHLRRFLVVGTSSLRPLPAVIFNGARVEGRWVPWHGEHTISEPSTDFQTFAIPH